MRIVRRGRDVFGQTAPEERWYHLRVADMQEMEDLPDDVPVDIPSEQPPLEIYEGATMSRRLEDDPVVRNSLEQRQLVKRAIEGALGTDLSEAKIAWRDPETR